MQVQSVYEDTVDLLKHLDENQLMAIHSVIVELTTAQEKWHSPLEIHSDEELLVPTLVPVTVNKV